MAWAFAISLCILAAGIANAAPLHAVDLSASAATEVSAVRGIKTDTPSATRSRSLDLLIDLQPRTAGLEFNERRQREGSVRTTDSASPGNPGQRTSSHLPKAAAASGGGLFGSGATPVVSTRKVANDSSFDASAGRNVNADTRRADGGDASASNNGLWSLLPLELVEYIRDNRETVVVAAVSLLLLIWAASVALARSR